MELGLLQIGIFRVDFDHGGDCLGGSSLII